MSGNLLVIKLERLNTDRLKCSICTKICVNKKCLEQHTRWHETNKNLTLNGFREHCESAQVLIKRVNIFKCGLCTRGFTNVKYFQNHQFNDHVDDQIDTNHINAENNNNIINKPYKCNTCGMRFAAESTLKAHSVTHRPFEHWCHCGIGYFQLSDLKAHKRLVHPIKIEKIEKTTKPKTTNQKPKVKKSKKINSIQKCGVIKLKKNIKKEFVCQLCDETFKLKDMLLSHVCDNGKQHRCYKCSAEFINLEQLEKHLLEHIEKLTCTHCGDKFRCGKRLVLHIIKTHGKEAKTQFENAVKEGLIAFNDIHQCKYCNKLCYDKYALALHLRVHTGEKPYVCPYCNKPFGDPSALLRHKRMHEGIKPYKCEHCPIAYSDKSALIGHIKRKHAKQTYECKYCGKKLATSSSLEMHLNRFHKMIHDKRFKCDDCGKMFTTKNYVRNHILLMHLKKPYKQRPVTCDYCKQSFKTKYVLESHIMRAHMITVYCNGCGDKFVSETMFKLHRSLCVQTTK